MPLVKQLFVSHQGISSDNDLVRKDTLVLLFSNHGSHRLYPLIKVGRTLDERRLKKYLLVSMLSVLLGLKTQKLWLVEPRC